MLGTSSSILQPSWATTEASVTLWPQRMERSSRLRLSLTTLVSLVSLSIELEDLIMTETRSLYCRAVLVNDSRSFRVLVTDRTNRHGTG